jgi:hypothetical protein
MNSKESEVAMKTSFKILLMLIMVAFASVSIAQNATVTYLYDDCGNRILRSIGFKKSDDKSHAKNAPIDEVWFAEVNDSFAGASLSLFPNPTPDRFSLVLFGQEVISVHATLCTMEGSIIDERDITHPNEEFDLSGKSAGIYLLRLQTGNETQTWKIIKKK